MNIQPATANLPAVRQFLRDHAETTLFLASNLDAHGPTLSEHPNSGEFQCVLDGNAIIGVFCLTRRGNLLVELGGRATLAPLVVDACTASDLATRGVLGEWTSAHATWQELLQRGLVVEQLARREVLFSLPLDQCPFATSTQVRRLQSTDYDRWIILNTAYLAELGLGTQMTEAQHRADFSQAAEAGHWWGYWDAGNLVSIAALNARHGVLGQVGGVFTSPQHRRLGYSRELLQTLALDSRERWSLTKLILFTGEDNFKALALYRSLGFESIGEFAMFFGHPSNQGA